MLNQNLKLTAAFCFLASFALASCFQSTSVEAQIVKQACGCGKSTSRSCEAENQSVVTSDILISTELLPEVAVADQPRLKKTRGCKGSRKKGGFSLKRSCPQCDCDFCELKTGLTTEKQTCFEVKQKEVCIPPVTLPWKKCCPPRKAKVRVVNVLSKKTVQCPKCKYEWTVHEPEIPKAAGGKPEASDALESAPKVAPIEEVDPVEPAAPKMNLPDPPEAGDMKLDSVPQPPLEDV